MSSIMKALLLLAALLCISSAQMHRSESCLCRGTRGLKGIKTQIKDLHIYPQTVFCTRVEIVLTMNDGNRFCVNPQLPLVKRLVEKMLKGKQRSSTAAPAATLSSATSSQSTSQL